MGLGSQAPVAESRRARANAGGLLFAILLLPACSSGGSSGRGPIFLPGYHQDSGHLTPDPNGGSAADTAGGSAADSAPTPDPGSPAPDTGTPVQPDAPPPLATDSSPWSTPGAEIFTADRPSDASSSGCGAGGPAPAWFLLALGALLLRRRVVV